MDDDAVDEIDRAFGTGAIAVDSTGSVHVIAPPSEPIPTVRLAADGVEDDVHFACPLLESLLRVVDQRGNAPRTQAQQPEHRHAAPVGPALDERFHARSDGRLLGAVQDIQLPLAEWFPSR